MKRDVRLGRRRGAEECDGVGAFRWFGEDWRRTAPGLGVALGYKCGSGENFELLMEETERAENKKPAQVGAGRQFFSGINVARF